MYLYTIGDPVNNTDPSGHSLKGLANSVSSAVNKVLGKASQKDSAQSSNSSKGNAIVGTPPQSSNTKKGSQQDKAVQAIIDGALKGQSNVTNIANAVLQNVAAGTNVMGTILDMAVKTLSTYNRVLCSVDAMKIGQDIKGKAVNVIIDTLRSYGLNNEEIMFVVRHPFTMPGIRRAVGIAINAEIVLFGAQVDMVQQNSFKHAFWLSLLAYYIGPTLALKFGEAHEVFDNGKDKDPEIIRGSAMDLHNNRIGIAIYMNNVKSEGAAADYLNKRLGSEENRKAALEEYSSEGYPMYNMELMLMLLCVDEYLEAVQIKYINGQLVSLNGEDITGKLVFY